MNSQITSKYMDWYPIEDDGDDGYYLTCPKCNINSKESGTGLEICKNCNLIYKLGCILVSYRNGCRSYYPIIFIKHTESSFIIADSDYLNLSEKEQSEYSETCLCFEYNCDRPESYDYFYSYTKDEYPEKYKCNRCNRH